MDFDQQLLFQMSKEEGVSEIAESIDKLSRMFFIVTNFLVYIVINILL